MTKRIEDEIVEEIRRRREAHAKSFDYDLKRITEDLQRQQQESGTPVVRRPSRKPQVPAKRSSA
jgi:hypothetical protein